jgi:hypothetical protein
MTGGTTTGGTTGGVVVWVLHACLLAVMSPRYAPPMPAVNTSSHFSKSPVAVLVNPDQKPHEKHDQEHQAEIVELRL